MVMPRGDAVEAGVRETVDAAAYVGAQYPVFLPKLYHIAEELEHILILFQQAPVQPGDEIILTVSIVIAELGVTEFIPGKITTDSPQTGRS